MHRLSSVIQRAFVRRRSRPVRENATQLRFFLHAAFLYCSGSHCHITMGVQERVDTNRFSSENKFLPGTEFVSSSPKK